MSVQLFNLLGISRDSVFEEKTSFADYLTDFIKQTDASDFSGTLLPESIEGPINPWFFAQELLSKSSKLPFIAINPCFVHPLYVVRNLYNLSTFYQRPIYLNFITGGSAVDSLKINDSLSKEEKYNRLDEFITIVQELLTANENETYSFKGTYYTLENIVFKGSLPKELQPVFHIAGSSEFAQSLIEKKNMTQLKMGECLANVSLNKEKKLSYHIGIIARETSEEAQEVLASFCKVDRKRTILQQISIKQSNSVWKQKVYESYKNSAEDSIYNLTPFVKGYSDVPYLVGSYTDIANYVQQYIDNKIESIIIEIPKTGFNEMLEIDTVITKLRL
ncbi:4-(gamma-L-glutamylamino)butanoyl-[BtrI acyl-carrier protein] monooxygenase BtrO [Kordia antarctica]|uniref:4-(Gamma-L-glutamylamino)butanoyl-[BtrI acyl-carrier protein] monooxygenase BtrO n=1 Tax=Kordia antarctica TaxID=1218801 RepID=A0A7L4ZTM6_9FLAO|nr:LLM class flavin-dependent oxidoreductase [Kordia antarctica]QHI38914.1 4-(gamma-L-glutamylamino)butanoyl-[BtrI acyl-carrier protein] monooxygenase BtrO [Kordia antarctica]